MTTDVPTRAFRFKHPEADTLLLCQARVENFTDTDVIDSEDTDVYVQADYVSSNLR